MASGHPKDLYKFKKSLDRALDNAFNIFRNAGITCDISAVHGDLQKLETLLDLVNEVESDSLIVDCDDILLINKYKKLTTSSR